MRRNFQAKFKAFQDLCINESVCLGEGVISSVLASEAEQVSLKLFVVCNVKTGCILNLILYTDSNTLIDPGDELKISGYVV